MLPFTVLLGLAALFGCINLPVAAVLQDYTAVGVSAVARNAAVPRPVETEAERSVSMEALKEELERPTYPSAPPPKRPIPFHQERSSSPDRFFRSVGQRDEEMISVSVSAVPSAYGGSRYYGDDAGASAIFPEDQLSWSEKSANERWKFRPAHPEPLFEESYLELQSAARKLMMTTSVIQENLTAFDNFPGVVKLKIYTKIYPLSDLCTAVLVAPTVLLTAPACFTEAEAPITLPTNYDGSSSVLSPYPVVAGNGQQIGVTNFHYFVYNTGQEGYRLSVVNITRFPSSFRTNPLTGLKESIVPYYGIVEKDLEPPLAGYSGGYGPNNLTLVVNDIYPLGNGIQRMANVTLTGRGQSVRRIGKCSGVRIGGNLYTDRIARLRDSYVRMCGQYGDMGAPLLFDAGNSTYLVGGTLIDVDVYPCATNKATYTSVPFRQEWIKAKVQLLQTVVSWIPEFCPTASQTSTMTGTGTATGTPSTSMIINVTIIIPPPPEPFPWWFVAAIGSAILGLIVIAAGIYWYVRRTLKIMRAAQGYDKAYFSRPHKDQIAPPPEFKSLQKDKLFKATAGDLGGLRKGEDAAAVADEIFEASNEEGGDIGAKTNLYKQKLTSDEFMKRLQKRIARKTARVAPGGASIASSSVSSGGMDMSPAKSKILEARDRNADFAATTRSLRPRFNQSAVVSGSATINAEIPDMLMLATPAVYMPLQPPVHPVGSGSSALGAKVAAARTAAASYSGVGGVGEGGDGSPERPTVLVGPTGMPIPFVPVLPVPQHPHLNGAGVPLTVSVASPGRGHNSYPPTAPLASPGGSPMAIALGSPVALGAVNPHFGPLSTVTPHSPIMVPHYNYPAHSGGSGSATAGPPAIVGFGSSYVATAAMAGLSPRTTNAGPISIAVTVGSPYNARSPGGAAASQRSPR